MAVTVKTTVLWRKEVDNQLGVLARTLEPQQKAVADLRVLMAYRYPGNEAKAAVEIYPINGKKLTTAATEAGLTASSIPALLVEGDNKPGLAYQITQAIADARVNLSFVVAHVVGRRYAATIGFETEADTKKAATLIKRAKARSRRK
jgi:hypothetical protein